MNTAEILRASRAKIADQSSWTQGAFARDKNGTDVEPDSADAVCWCAYGPLYLYGSDMWAEPANYLDYAAEKLFNNLCAASVNDELDHAAVLRVYDAAIAAAEAEGQ